MFAIPEREVFRYLGYRDTSPSEDIVKIINECASVIKNEANAKSLSRIFDIVINEGTVLLGGLILKSKSLAKHVKGCEKAILFASTLGIQVDRIIARFEHADMSRALILNACAAAAIESFSDDECKILSEKLVHEGLYLKPRFSPGYGDLSLSYQKDILSILEAQKKIGLSLTDSLMLIPAKSVTAVIGVSASRNDCSIDKCALCDKTDCAFRSGGV